MPFAPNQFFTALRLTVSIAAFTAWLVRADVRAATVNTISVITFKGLRSTTDLYFPKTDSITSELPNNVSPGLASAACPSKNCIISAPKVRALGGLGDLFNPLAA